MRRHLAMIAVAGCLLAACKPDIPEPDRDLRIAAEREAAAAPILEEFDSAYAQGDWGKALVRADMLRLEHAGTQAEAKAMEKYDEVKQKAVGQREDQRLRSLWDYQSIPTEGKEQISAAIWSKNKITLDGGESKVQLIFRDHPSWKRSTYIVLQRGDIDCYKGCKVKVTVDGKTHMLDGLRPDTREAISMFINPDRALWKSIFQKRALSIEIPVKGGPKQTAEFEVTGLDIGRMPKAWSK